MAFDKKPTNLFAGLTLTDGDTKISIPLTSIPELTAAEANPTTGDLRKVILALQERIYQYYNALPVADRPVEIIQRRFTSTDDTTGDITRTYTGVAVCAATGIEVKDEPT